MKPIYASLVITVVLAGAASAQTTGGLCHHAGLTYSPGSMVSMGQSLQKCVVEGGISVWTPVSRDDAEPATANCVSGGREFGQGSVLTVGAVELTCRSGAWREED